MWPLHRRPNPRPKRPSSAAAATRRSAAPAGRRDDSRATCRSSATAARSSSPSRTWSRSTPMRTTPPSSTGSEKLFCPLAIGDVEQRLDTDRFVRVHRSHIVNIDARGRASAHGRQRADRDGRRPLHRAGQPQPDRRAEVARRRAERPAPPASPCCSAVSVFFCPKNSDPAGWIASIALTQFVQARRHSCRNRSFGARTGSLVRRRLLLRRTHARTLNPLQNWISAIARRPIGERG